MRKVMAIEKSEIERLSKIHDRFRLFIYKHRKSLSCSNILYDDLDYLARFLEEAEGKISNFSMDFCL